MAADEEAREHAVDDIAMTDDRLADLGLNGAVVSTELVGELLNLRIDAGDIRLGHNHFLCSNSISPQRRGGAIEVRECLRVLCASAAISVLSLLIALLLLADFFLGSALGCHQTAPGCT